jgi:hypothetical protein
MGISKPQSCRFHAERVGDELVLTGRAQLFEATAWFAVFLTLAAFCVFLIVQATRATTTQDALLRLLFLAVCIPGACYPLRLSLGTERLRIGPDGLDHRSQALIPLQERHVPLGEIKGINYGPEIETLGKPVRFRPGIEPGGESVAGRPAPEASSGIDTRSGHQPPSQHGRGREADCVGRSAGARRSDPGAPLGLRDLLEDQIGPHRVRAEQGLEPGQLRLQLPLSHPLLRLEFPSFPRRYPSLLFSYRRRLPPPLGAQALLAPAPLLAPLRRHPLHPGQWCAADHPFWGERWAFRPGEITARRTTVFGWGRLQRVEAESIARVELRKGARIRTRWVPRVYREQAGDAPYSLGLIGQQGQDLLLIADLTEGEARWMGGRICELLRS